MRPIVSVFAQDSIFACLNPHYYVGLNSKLTEQEEENAIDTGTSKSAEQDHFDLLPFIAIMMCLLGTLLLVTMSMAAINVGAGASEGWAPEPDPGAKTAVLIEWDGKYAVWHSENGIQRLEENFIQYVRSGKGWFRYDPGGRGAIVTAPEPNALDPQIEYLVARRSTHYALFAVRPSGFASFRKFAARFEDRNIDTGSEPIEQGKSVRLVLPKGTP